MSVNCLTAGTITNPPPTPSMPVDSPASARVQTNEALQRAVQRNRPVWASIWHAYRRP
jgi:hypothetical protein